MFISLKIEELVETLTHNFNSTWKTDLQRVVSDIKGFFPNITVSEDLIKAALSQFAVHYTRWEDINKKYMKVLNNRAFLPLATITYEIRRYV